MKEFYDEVIDNKREDSLRMRDVGIQDKHRVLEKRFKSYLVRKKENQKVSKQLNDLDEMISQKEEGFYQDIKECRETLTDLIERGAQKDKKIQDKRIALEQLQEEKENMIDTNNQYERKQLDL